MSNLNLDGLTDAQLRMFAVRCARRVQHLMTDPRSLAALDVAERYANGEATDAELAAAWDVARAAAWAWAATAAEAAWAAASAAAAAARDAADAAAGDARAAARAAERAAQAEILEQIRKEVKP